MKFKNVKRVAALGLAVIMSAGLMTGCGASSKNESSAVKTEETAKQNEETKAADPIPVRMIMYGEESPRMKELMENEIYQKVLEEINVELEIDYLPWTEVNGGKTELMFSAGEKFMCFTDTDFTSKMVGKGYFADLTDVLEANAPDLYANSDMETNIKQFTINGRIYSVPIGNKPNAGEDYLIMVRKDLMEEVGVEEITSIEDLENFYTLCKEKHPDYIGLGRSLKHKIFNGAIESDMNVLFINSFVITDGNAENDSTLYSYYESEEFKQACEIAKRWREMGIIPSYLLSNPQQSSSEFAAGRAMFAVGANDRIFEMMDSLRSTVPDAVLENVYLGDASEKPLMTRGGYNTAYAISAAIEDPEELAAYIKVLNLLQKNQEWVDLWTYGVEGTDYTLTDSGSVERICTDEILPSWLCVNTNFRRYADYVTEEQIETFNTQADGSIVFKNAGFVFDTESVKAEYAQLQTVKSEYLDPIYNGFKDYDENIDEAIKKLKDAGIDKYMAEMQKQFGEFMKNKAN